MKAVALVLGVLWMNAAYAGDTAYVLAKVKTAKFVMAAGDLPENQAEDLLTLDGVFETRLAILRVIHGKVTDKTITVRLIAHQGRVLLQASPILVLLTSTAPGQFEARGWSELESLACLPERIALDDGLETSLPLKMSEPAQRCAKLD